MNASWAKIIIGGLLLLTVSPLLIYFLRPQNSLVSRPPEVSRPKVQRHEIMIGRSPITVELATTPTEQERGLSGRSTLPKDNGMLFIFSAPDYYQFWMKEMLFPIDIIWIRGGEVVDVTPNLTPESFPRTFAPKTPADNVLEVPSGWSADHQVIVGTKAFL